MEEEIAAKEEELEELGVLEENDEDLNYLRDVFSVLSEELKDSHECSVSLVNDYDRYFVREYTVEDFISDFDYAILALN